MPYSPQQNQLFQPFQIGQNGVQSVKPRTGAGNFFLGEQEQYQNTPTQTPQGMEFLQQLLSQSSEGLKNPYAGFDPIAQDATRDFNTQTIPGIAERFTAMGGGQRSSAFQGALGSAGSGLAQKLAAMKAEYGLKNRDSLLRQGQLGLTPQFETQYKERGTGFLENLLNEVLSKGLGAASGSYGKQLGQFAGNKSFGQQGQQSGGGDISSLITKLLPLLL